MKYDYYMKGLLGALAVAFVLFGAACSKDKGSNNNTVAGQCGVGYVYSPTQGCLTQGNCSYGQAMVGGYCQTVATNLGCQAGQVNSQYGCIPQGSCGSGYGSYNNQCVVATTPNTYPGGTACTMQYPNNCGGGYQQYPNSGYYGNNNGYNNYYQQYPYYGGYSQQYGNPYGYNPYGYGGAGAGAGGYFYFGF